MTKTYELNAQAGGADIVRADRPCPAPGRGEALVRMRAASLNYRDLLIAGTRTGGTLPPGLIPLSDGAGEVEAVGEGVTGVKPGDRVMGAFYPDWISGPITAAKRARALGGTMDGMLAEYVVLPEHALIPVPAHLSFEEAATLPCAALTAWNALTEAARVRPGDTVLLQGSGGVSIFALQFARLMGAEVIHLSGSEAKLERLHGMGAGHAVDYRRTPDWDAAVLSLTGGRGVDHVVEVGGPGTLERSFRAVRVGGTIVTIGFVGGDGGIDPRPVISRAIRLIGITVGSCDMFRRMGHAAELHGLKPVIDEIFAFDEAPRAYDALRSGRHFGKLVVTI